MLGRLPATVVAGVAEVAMGLSRLLSPDYQKNGDWNVNLIYLKFSLKLTLLVLVSGVTPFGRPTGDLLGPAKVSPLAPMDLRPCEF